MARAKRRMVEPELPTAEVLAAFDAGCDTRDIARQFGVTEASVYRCLRTALDARRNVRDPDHPAPAAVRE